MKKIFTLLAFVMMATCAMAQQYFKGTWHSNPGAFSDYDGNATVTVTDMGSYFNSKIVFDHVVLGNDDLGEVTISNVWTEVNGSTTSFSFGNVPFTTNGGNLSDVTGCNIQGYGSMDDDGITLTFQYFEYNTMSLRMVKFTGTPMAEPIDPTKPTVVSTENFSQSLHSQVDGSATSNIYDGVKASLTEYSDGTYTLAFDNVECENGFIGNVVLAGLTKNSSDEFVGYVKAELTSEGSILAGKDIYADVIAKINEDGDLEATFPLLTEDGATRIDFEYKPAAFEPEEPVSVEGTLSGFTHTADGDFNNTAASTLTLTETAEDVYKVELTNVVLPSATISLGTVALEDVACESDEATNTATFTKTGGVCTTTSEHPLYTEVDLKSFNADVQLQAGATEDDDPTITSVTATLVIDNYDEEITYTFSLNPIVDGVKTITAADGTVKRIYTLSGMSVNSLQRGINVVRTADGKTMKVLKK